MHFKRNRMISSFVVVKKIFLSQVGLRHKRVTGDTDKRLVYRPTVRYDRKERGGG